MGFYWAFLFLPAADFFVGVDTFNSRETDYKVLRERYGGAEVPTRTRKYRWVVAVVVWVCVCFASSAYPS